MLFWSFFGNRLRGIKEVDHIAAMQLINHKNALMLDVREQSEYAAGHVVNSKLIPLGKLRERIGELEKYRERPHCGDLPQRATFRLRVRFARQAGFCPGLQPEWRYHRLAESQSAAGEMMNKVVMYCTEVCPYCVRAEQLLKRKGITDIEKIRIDLQPEMRDIMIQKTGRRTVPQIYINGEHVGGYDDMAALDRAGKLDVMLSK